MICDTGLYKKKKLIWLNLHHCIHGKSNHTIQTVTLTIPQCRNYSHAVTSVKDRGSDVGHSHILSVPLYSSQKVTFSPYTSNAQGSSPTLPVAAWPLLGPIWHTDDRRLTTKNQELSTKCKWHTPHIIRSYTGKYTDLCAPSPSICKLQWVKFVLQLTENTIWHHSLKTLHHNRR